MWTFEFKIMKATQHLHKLGQSLWLDNITRDLLNNGELQEYIDELSVTGLTSNPTIFDQAIKNSAAYDDAMAGDASLFAREDYVEEAWRIVDPVLKAGTPVFEYEPNTWGPTEVERVTPVGGWHNPITANQEVK